MAKTVLITGATRGIGYALAEKYVADGDLVLVGTRDLDRGLEAIDHLRANGGQARLLQIDLLDQGSVMQAAQWVGQQFGQLDLLINNAGIFDDHDVLASHEDAESLRQTFDVNVLGTYLVTQQMLPWLQAAHGMVISMSDQLATFTNFATEQPTTGLGQRLSRMSVNAMTVLFQNELAGAVQFRAVTPGEIASSPARKGGQPVSVAVDLIQQIDAHKATDWDGKLIGVNGIVEF
ncbi:SDR family NAD(P)-dependent oxidoreductase [Furfurilactobacillus sp. WILCCON 0119]|uniref:SDR family NAD(P)-dependent oxidoreductase n=1 Tax=Furfurilactobacillus entadae TaxID=2922307 RepID=UPI0035EB4C83